MSMPWAYFDTSALVKRYIQEQGSSLARSLMKKYQFLSSVLCSVEIISALCRRRFQGELSPEDFKAIFSRINQDREF
ncbi:MAG TPA: hypothetical protein DF383_12810, partial [Deltaproteobacteria bacterium]|nr:hypothetical protein [Deltaproteobacteria bacterium]